MDSNEVDASFGESFSATVASLGVGFNFSFFECGYKIVQ